MRVKLFDYAQHVSLFEVEENKIEATINEWLAANPKVVMKDIRLGSAMLPTADQQTMNFESFDTLTQVLVL